VLRKSVLLIIPARDFNEEEYLIIKGSFENQGFRVFIASDATGLCTGKKGLRVKADISLLNIHPGNFDALIFIGGSGVKEYWNNQILHGISRKFTENRKPAAAICSAAVILAKAGLLNNIAATCYSKDRKELERAGAEYKESPVVVRKNIITAQGPASAAEFADAIISQLKSK
jgi:protease I